MPISSAMAMAGAKPAEPTAPPGGNVENRQPPSEPPPPPPSSGSANTGSQGRFSSGALSTDMMNALLKYQED